MWLAVWYGNRWYTWSVVPEAGFKSRAKTVYSTVQYIPRNMHTVLLCFALLWLCNRSQWIHMKYLSIFIRVALLALGQSLDCHSASEVSLMDMGKSVNVKPQQSTAKQKPCAYFLWYTVSVGCNYSSLLWYLLLEITKYSKVYIYTPCCLSFPTYALCFVCVTR